MKTWQANAQSVQYDIVRSKAIAKDILSSAEAPTVSGIAIKEAEEKAAFLVAELNYNARLRQALADVTAVWRVLDEVELARFERRVLDALRLLESRLPQWLPFHWPPAVLRLTDVEDCQRRGKCSMPFP